MMNVRACAAKIIFQVVDKGQSLSAVLPKEQKQVAEKDGALLQEICYGVLRWLPRLEATVSELMDNPLKGKKRVCHHLILVGLYQLIYLRIPDHAAISETVNAVKTLKEPRLKGLINALLRNYQRTSEQLDAKATSFDAGLYGHPNWFIKLVKSQYPDQWEKILEASNTKAPMWLRVNCQHNTRDQYQALLEKEGIKAQPHPQAKDALKLEKPRDVTKLPGFKQGWISVQDAAAQLAVDYLSPEKNELILDACAAPGGKSAHILERQPDVKLVAIDADANRLERVEENLSRLKLNARVLCADARYPEKWWHGEQFDRILLDAPCSALGVIRRHPDIKWLRRSEDIEVLAELQYEILTAMWKQLKSGGTLVYATCSISQQENTQQISRFLKHTPDAKLARSEDEHIGRQILPGEEDMDGFYYAVIQKD